MKGEDAVTITTDDEIRLINGAKGSLYDSLLNSIDDKFHLTIQVFTPPTDLLPFLEGKELKTEEAQSCRRLYDQWTEDVLKVMKRKPTAETLEQFFAVLPEPFKGNLAQALIQGEV